MSQHPDKKQQVTDVERARDLLSENPEQKTVKEVWQMTKSEYEARFGRLKKNTTGTGGFSPHESAVEVALNKGLPVPPAVLADYPNLADQ
jgi:hypothetical protein